MTNKPFPLPGDLAPHATVEQVIRVNQAGEYGARRIYQGQLAVLEKRTNPASRKAAAEIRHMAAQEEVHLETFNRLIGERRVRPSALAPLWHAAGFVLGAGTALMGVKSAMACTVAVESVIAEHYGEQMEQLEQLDAEAEKPLCETIAQFRAEEMEHHDTALDEGAEQAPLYSLLSHGIQTASRLAIWVAKRV